MSAWTGQIGDDFTDGNQLAALTLHRVHSSMFRIICITLIPVGIILAPFGVSPDSNIDCQNS